MWTGPVYQNKTRGSGKISNVELLIVPQIDGRFDIHLTFDFMGISVCRHVDSCDIVKKLGMNHEIVEMKEILDCLSRSFCILIKTKTMYDHCQILKDVAIQLVAKDIKHIIKMEKCSDDDSHREQLEILRKCVTEP